MNIWFWPFVFVLGLGATGMVSADLVQVQSMSIPTRVLLTAFEPFDGEKTNASQEMLLALVQDLKENPLAPTVVFDRVILPVVYEDSPRILIERIHTFSPDIVISLGEAPSDRFQLETRAKNEDRSSTPDNKGEVRNGKPILIGGAQFLPSTLPIQSLSEAFKAASYPYVVSHSAGGYVCNHLFYNLMGVRGIKAAGFIHVPSWVARRNRKKSFRRADWAHWGAGALRIAIEESVASQDVAFQIAPSF